MSADHGFHLNKGINRRRFLQAAILGSAAVATSGCKPASRILDLVLARPQDPSTLEHSTIIQSADETRISPKGKDQVVAFVGEPSFLSRVIDTVKYRCNVAQIEEQGEIHAVFRIIGDPAKCVERVKDRFFNRNISASR